MDVHSFDPYILQYWNDDYYENVKWFDQHYPFINRRYCEHIEDLFADLYITDCRSYYRNNHSKEINSETAIGPISERAERLWIVSLAWRLPMCVYRPNSRYGPFKKSVLAQSVTHFEYFVLYTPKILRHSLFYAEITWKN